MAKSFRRRERPSRSRTDSESIIAAGGDSQLDPSSAKQMSPPRVLLISRRFWPLVGGAEQFMASLAAELVARGAMPHVLTAQWAPGWPREIFFQSAQVTRLPGSRHRSLANLNHMRRLRRWIARRGEQFDLAYASPLRHDALVAVKRFQDRFGPVVLRAETGGPAGDCAWLEKNRFGRRIRRCCQRAAAVVAPTPAVADELRQSGFAPERIHQIPGGVPLPAVANAEEKKAARAALVDVHEGLSLGRDAELVVSVGPLQRDTGLGDLLRAFKPIAARRRRAQLWLIGEGPQRRSLGELIRRLELGGRVEMPGSFESIDGVLAAADLFVLPSHQQGLSLALLEAMAAGLPSVATDSPGNRYAAGEPPACLLTRRREPEELSAAIIRLLDDPNGGCRAVANQVLFLAGVGR